MRPIPPLLVPALALLLCLGATDPAALSAQQAAALELTVVDASTGEPIVGAEVVLPGRRPVRTPRTGTVLIEGITSEQIAGDVTHLGYRARSFALPIAAGATLSLSVPLEPRPIVLEPVDVEVAAEAPPSPRIHSQHLKEFYERVERGGGHYITRRQIESFNPRQMSDLFRMIPGLGLVNTAMGERASMSSQRVPTYDRRGALRECPIQYFVDGTPYEAAGPEALYLDIRPQEVEGIEVYTGMVGLPPQFRRTNRNCGVILIWKRERI